MRKKLLLFVPAVCVFTALLLLAVPSCQNGSTQNVVPPTPLDEPMQNAIFGYSTDNWFFIQNVTDEGMGNEMYSGQWDLVYDSMTSFTMADGRQYIFGHRETGYWFIQEILSTGDLGFQTDSNHWNNYYPILSGFTIPGGRTFIYGQKPSNGGAYWFIQEILPEGKLGSEADSGHWNNWYPNALVINPNSDSPVLFGHSYDGYWFLQPISQNGIMLAETDNGHWNNYYATTKSFTVGGAVYLFGQDADSAYWFIQEISASMGRETDNGHWNNYYDTVTPFSINGRSFLFLQKESTKYWNIMEVLTGGKMGGQIGPDGHWGHYYAFVSPLSVNPTYLNTSNWMTNNYDLIKDRTLHEIAIPGSHDAGMNGKTHCWLGDDCNTQTQISSIYDQLDSGARYFDIRPTRYGDSDDDEWYAGHYQETGWGWLGCTGQSLDSILEDVVRYCVELNPIDGKELIILNFSHCYVVHAKGGSGGRDCYDHEWVNDVLDTAKTKLAPFLTDWSKYGNPAQAVFGDRETGQYVLLRFETDAVSSDPTSGVYTSDDFPIYNDYSNTESFSEMSTDQQQKLTESNNHNEKLFLLSWTLTLSDSDAEKCSRLVDHYPTILDMAMEANNQLMANIQSWVSAGTITQTLFPNIVYVDRFYEPIATRTAIYLNQEYSELDK